MKGLLITEPEHQAEEWTLVINSVCILSRDYKLTIGTDKTIAKSVFNINFKVFTR